MSEEHKTMRIKDIAEALHLSVSTVSKALNGAFDLSKETKEMVLEYAKANGYKSRDERLSVKNKRRLCLIFEDANENPNNVILPLSVSFSKYAAMNNFEVIQTPLSSITDSYNKFMAKNNFDGAFILGFNYNSHLDLADSKYPTVLYDNTLIGEKISNINNDNLNSFKALVDTLHNLGHEKIGFIHGDKASFVSNERFAGYIIGLGMNDLQFNPDYVYYGEFNQESGCAAASYFKDLDCTAIICASDTIALGLMHGLKEYGIKIPNDISVTGYDGLEIGKFVTPSLTTITQDLDLIGEKAFGQIASMIMNRTSQRIVVNGKITLRESIGPVKKN